MINQPRGGGMWYFYFGSWNTMAYFMFYRIMPSLHIWLLEKNKKFSVWLYRKGYRTLTSHRCSPTTDPHGNSWLPGCPSGPVRPSLDNLMLSQLPGECHIDVGLSADTRSTWSSQPQGSFSQAIPENLPPSSWITRASHCSRQLLTSMWCLSKG